jgi:hypothetical protein
VTGFARLVLFAKVAAIIGAAWTLFVCFSIIGWQAWIWADEGNWPILQFSDVMDSLRSPSSAIYMTASSDEFEKSNLLEAILSIPAIVPLLVASAMIIGFYFWLRRIEHHASRGS